MEALFTAGRERLKKKLIDDLSIEELCASIGCTVGVFYRRFKDKESYFAALQAVILEQRDEAFREMLSRAKAVHSSLEDCCDALASGMVGVYRRDAGVFRSSLMRLKQHRESWAPFKRQGRQHRKLLVSWFQDQLPHMPKEELELRVKFIHQVISGTLVHALLNDAGPLSIHDRRIVRELGKLASRYLAVQPKDSR
jgi:AcrR family transcriptional regulator